MTDPQSMLNQIRRLLGSFPSRGGDEALILHGYLSALDGFDIDMIEGGVDIILRGELPGHDGRFAPTAPQLATACRQAAERAARRRYLDQITTPRLPAPEIVKTPEQRARAMAQVQEFVASQGPSLMDERAASHASREKMAKHDSFFADEFVPTEGGVGRISKTLAKKLGYSVGAPESDEAAA